jgi:hypothetical protein
MLEGVVPGRGAIVIEAPTKTPEVAWPEVGTVILSMLEERDAAHAGRCHVALGDGCEPLCGNPLVSAQRIIVKPDENGAFCPTCTRPRCPVCRKAYSAVRTPVRSRG